MSEELEIELIFEPQEEGGYSVYAPELPGLHTQGEDMDDALANARRRSRCTSTDSEKTASPSIGASSVAGSSFPREPTSTGGFCGARSGNDWPIGRPAGMMGA